MKIDSFKTKNKKPKVWSRKGVCPSCGVSTGSKHREGCKLEYEFLKPRNTQQ